MIFNKKEVLNMKKAMLAIFAFLLLFAAACTGETDSLTTTKAPTTTAAATEFTPDPSIELPPIVEIASLIPAGYPTDNVYHAETDDPITSPSDPLYREETGCEYFFEDDYLMYTETEDGTPKTSPLCAREGCLHAAESIINRARCHAYAPHGLDRSVNYYNGRIYFTHSGGESHYTLSSINADGTDLRMEFQLPAVCWGGTDFNHTGHCGTAVFHRGGFYFTWLRTVGDNLFAAELWRYDPENPEAGPQCIWRSDNILPDTAHWYPVINAFSNYLYLYDMPTESINIWNSLVFDLVNQKWTVTEAPEGYSYGWDEIIDGERIVTYISLESIRVMEEFHELNKNGANLNTPDPTYKYITCRTEPDGSNPEVLPE